MGDSAAQYNSHDATTNLSRIIDRVLVAQARCEGLTLATRDPQIHRYEVDLLRM